ncbi:hypothetical protein [Plantactinospora soyae]|uniref:DUF4352 domain-containing protein n=1 Tax=Plantactinospora soyae TaxID=1544732 RepID=A0A927M925_9ACTN|nr:hypothetical protein [Plantactinospora soyae]MBE1487583.1 hypothetical protein [Plantactinospora soyae]
MGFRRTTVVGALALAMTLPLLGCDAFGGAEPTATEPTGSAGAAGAAPAGPDDLGEVIAARDVQVSENGNVIPIRVELHQLRRKDGFVTVNLRVTNTGTKGAGYRWQIADEFAGDIPGHTLAGVSLVDRKNRKQYLVARTAGAGAKDQDRYLASLQLANVFVQPGQSVNLYASFGAPPDDVQAVDVVVPNVPVFANVPLS